MSAHRAEERISMIRVAIAEPVARAFPEAKVTTLRVARLSVAAGGLPVREIAARAGKRLRREIDSVSALVSDPRIAGWREAVAACGLKPSTYKSGAEQLARRVLKGRDIATPLPVVDAYCAVSAAHLAPLGAYDISRLPRPDITLRHAEPADAFTPLAGRAESMPLEPAVVVYASGREVLCWCFNHRDAAATCLRGDTDDAVFMGEAVNAEQAAALDAAMVKLRDLLSAAGAVTGPIATVAAADGAAREIDVQPVL